MDLLVAPRVHLQVLDVVLAVWRIEHLRSVVRIFLFSNAHIDANVSITQGVVLEGDLKFVAIRDSLYIARFFSIKIN